MKAKVQDRNEWAKQRYKLFNEKIDSFREHGSLIQMTGKKFTDSYLRN